ncbi:MAG: zinc-dependent alcohol dehydrogenase [Acidobacteriota bacterium]
MQAAVWTGAGQLDIQERPVPEPQSHELLIENKAVGVCGSDFHVYQGQFWPAVPPLILGHEAAGVICGLGKDVRGFHAGDRVVINPSLYCGHCHFCRQGYPNQCLQRETIGMTRRDGAFADYFTVPAQNAHLLPPSVEWETAALVDSLACAIHALDQAPFHKSEAVVIFGAGPAGLCFTALSSLREASPLIVADVAVQRLGVAYRLGAHYTVDAGTTDAVEFVLNLTDELGAHLSIEASGAPQAILQCLKATRSRGKVLVYGIYCAPVNGVDFQDQHRREITIYGSSGALGSYPEAIELIASRRLGLQPIISHRLCLQDLPDFFEKVVQHRPENYLKAVVI